jgi:drug/metabolite transporter (DMT)-like permease
MSGVAGRTARAATAARPLPLVALAASSCMWGLAWIPLKALGAQGVGGVVLSLVASCAAGALLLPRLLSERSEWRHDPAGLWLIALLGGYSNLTFAVATMYGDIVRVMVLFYLLPVWSALGGRLFLGERLDRTRVAAVGIALTGAWLTLGGAEALQGSVHWPDWLAISCGMAFAANNLLFRAKQSVPVGSKTAAMVLGGALLAGVLLVAGVQAWPQVEPAAWAGTAGYGLAWLLLANLCTQYGVTHLEAVRASIIILLELVVAVASAVLIGGEQMSVAELTGGLLILGAGLLEARPSG